MRGNWRARPHSAARRRPLMHHSVPGCGRQSESYKSQMRRGISNCHIFRSNMDIRHASDLCLPLERGESLRMGTLIGVCIAPTAVIRISGSEAQNIPYHTGIWSGISSSSRLAFTTRYLRGYSARAVRGFSSSSAFLRGYVKVFVHFL